MEPYATYQQYTMVYSEKGIGQSEISSYWLFYGAQRVNECLGGFYTLPFSSNNATARQLSIDYGHLGILIRTRRQDDSEELINELEKRISYLTSSGSPMMTDSGESIFPDRNNVFDVYSSTKDWKPVFDLRDAVDQRIDPDQLDENWTDDIL